MKQQVVQIVYIFCILLSAKKLVDCKQYTCSENQYVSIDAQGRKSCLTCNDCPPGWGLYPPCGSEVHLPPDNIDCFLCTENTYSDEYGPSSCKSCGICSAHEIINKNCTAFENTNCSKACVRRYYYDDTTTHGCQPCSECCGNGEDIRIEECKKHDMPLSKQCSIHQSQHCKKREGTTTSSPGGLQPNNHDSRQKTALILGLGITGPLIIVLIVIILIKIARARGRLRGVQRRRRSDLEEIPMVAISSAAPVECLDITNPIKCILKTTIGEAPNARNLKRRLKILLDPPRSLGGDIRSLADAFGYTSNEIHFLTTRPYRSPTEELLSAEGHHSIEYLLEKLVYIDRDDDAAEELREYIRSQNCECEDCKNS